MNRNKDEEKDKIKRKVKKSRNKARRKILSQREKLKKKIRKQRRKMKENKRSLENKNPSSFSTLKKNKNKRRGPKPSFLPKRPKYSEINPKERLYGTKLRREKNRDKDKNE